MRQATKRKQVARNGKTSKKKGTKATVKRRRKHVAAEYGTSKLETDFAAEFLDKLGLSYEYQFRADEIGRYYDFLVEKKVLIEVDGDYYHAYGLLYEDMNAMQKRNVRVDQAKNKWALSKGYRLLRIWEHDIRKNPSLVMELLKSTFGIGQEGRHVNKLND